MKEKRSKACVQSPLNIQVIEKLKLGSKSCVLLRLVFKSKIDKDKELSCTKLLRYVLSCDHCGSARSQHYVLLPIEVQQAQWDHNGIAEYAGESNYVCIRL